jgi:serine/threonine-protein kinase PRP4
MNHDQDEDLLIEERKRRRKEILDKYKRSSPIKKQQLAKTVENTRIRSPPTIENTPTKFEFDMFNDEFVDQVDSIQKTTTINTVIECDDQEGYYKTRIGEQIQQYKIIKQLGKGVFSNVFEASSGPTKVAIKIIRRNDLMESVALKEIKILLKLSHPNIIKFKNNITHHEHICLLFELAPQSLLEYYKNNPIRKEFIKEILLGVEYIHSNEITHCDLKPDNILVSTDLKIKICDFGSSCYQNEIEKTTYIVSRFYRAPEIILNLSWGQKIDIFSVGCIIYEIFTKEVLFSGKNNNLMLFQFLEKLGRIPKKMIKKDNLSFENGCFVKRDVDMISQKVIDDL